MPSTNPGMTVPGTQIDDSAANAVTLICNTPNPTAIAWPKWPRIVDGEHGLVMTRSYRPWAPSVDPSRLRGHGRSKLQHVLEFLPDVHRL